MNPELLKAKMAELAARSSQGNKLLWKPEEGEQKIRLLPYIHSTNGWNFTEVFIHYDVAKSQFMSPTTFGRPDPIAEFGESVRADAKGNKEMYSISRRLTPKCVYVVPILVRGRENAGVKFWACSESQYSKILQYMNEPAYGDITDPSNGCDIKVTKTKATKPGEFNSIDMMPLPRSIVTDREDILKMCAQMPNVYTLWEEPSYDQLVNMLAAYSASNYQSAVPLHAATVSTTPQATTAPQAFTAPPVVLAGTTALGSAGTTDQGSAGTNPITPTVADTGGAQISSNLQKYFKQQ